MQFPKVSDVLAIIQNPHAHGPWSLQGLGMLRLYLDPERVQRLHVWNPDAAAPNVSRIHNHPWDFTSKIYAGSVGNFRYVETAIGREFAKIVIQCGPGGCAKSMPRITALEIWADERHYPGDQYAQLAAEIHDSRPEPGTVSVISRTFHGDTETATVFYDPERPWVSAEPREATRDEIDTFCALALKQSWKYR